MFNVNINGLKKALEHRGLVAVKNDDGTVTLNGVVFDRLYDLENYIEQFPRKDLP